MFSIHINIHLALGLIIASIYHAFFKVDLFQFTLIVSCALIADLDIIFIKYTKVENHRMLISHSIFPCILFFIIGFFSSSTLILTCGLAYLSHILLDTIDWGTNLFYFQKKPIGLMFLISKEEIENLNDYLSNYKVARSYFDFKYYDSKFMQSFEILLFIAMLFFMIFFAVEFILMIVVYFIGLGIHIFTHYHLKEIERT